MANKENNNDEMQIDLDQLSPEQLDQIAGGASVEEDENEADCGTNCGVYIVRKQE